LKSVFIIAIVAVAMIGVMVPSVIAMDIASFVDQTKDPQHYIDRYNNEPAYKEWFNENYSQYTSIYVAVGLEEPVPEPELRIQIPVSFVDLDKGTDYYLDRYYKESEYKIWFDKNYHNLTIEEAIGLVKPISIIREQYAECTNDAHFQFNQVVQKYMATTSSGIGAQSNLANSGITLDKYLIRCDDEYLVPLNDLAVTLIEQGEPFYALYYLDNTLELFPRYQVVLMNKGMAHFALEEYQDAKISFETALDIDPNLELAQQGVVETSRILEEGITIHPNCGTGTELVNGICQVVQTEEKSSKGGGCLIATATYGSELAPQVQQLRELRDNQLLNTESGTAFMGMFNDIYYSFSPVIADYERENPLFKEVVKIAITPMISSLSLMENANSESEVVSLGLSVIALNLGMYLGVPAVLIVGIKRRF
jgi:tetratricopeptide (TPR) repeat protein